MASLEEIFKREGKRLGDSFKEASADGKGTSGEVSDYREEALQELVERFYPSPYKITKGKITDSFGNVSASVDCVIVNPLHPNIIDRGDKLRIILADGVDTAIEVKPDVSRGNLLIEALEQSCSVKKLRRMKSPLLIPSTKDSTHVEYSLRLPSVIFSEKSNSNPDKLVGRVNDFYNKEGAELFDRFDLLVVNNFGIFENNMTTGKVGFFELGELTLAAMFWKMNRFIPSVVHMKTPMINGYMNTFPSISHKEYGLDYKYEGK